MTTRILRVHVPDDETLIAGVAVRQHADGGFVVQEYRMVENLSGSEMARLLHELATSLELEEMFDE